MSFEWHSAGSMFSLSPSSPYIARILETFMQLGCIGEAFHPAKGDEQFNMICRAAQEAFMMDPQNFAALGDPYTFAKLMRLKSKGLWNPSYGDRTQELVLIGVHLDKPKIQAALERCLLTRKEYEAGPTSWRKIPDPFCGGQTPKLCWDLPINQSHMHGDAAHHDGHHH